jgi:hypothetical protein
MARDKDPFRARLGKLGSASASAAFVLALSFAIAWPLWSLATKARRPFTLTVIAALALVLASFVALAAARRIRGGSRRRARAAARGRRGKP